MQSKIQSITNGGSINFQYSFGDKNCDSICKSKYVQKGCKYGFRCNVVPTCQSSENCICELQMSCKGKLEDDSATFDETSGSSEITSVQYLGNCQNINVYLQFENMEQAINSFFYFFQIIQAYSQKFKTYLMADPLISNIILMIKVVTLSVNPNKLGKDVKLDSNVMLASNVKIAIVYVLFK